MATLIRKIEEQTEGIGMDRREAHEGIQMGRKGRRKRKQKKVKVGTQKTRSHRFREKHKSLQGVPRLGEKGLVDD